MKGPEYRFEQLVRQIVAAHGFELENAQHPIGQPDRGFDIEASLGGDGWAIEVKYYRTARAQTSLISRAAERLQVQATANRMNRAMLVVSSFIRPDRRESLEKRHGVVFVDSADLRIMAQKVPEIEDELDRILQDQRDTPPTPEKLHDPIKIESGRPFERLQESELDREGSDLCNELKNLGLGKKHWRNYEKLCEKILRYLFADDLLNWKDQKRTDDGLNRFDLICRLSPKRDFWRFVVDHLDSRYVMFEFKNYRAKIKQGQILTTEKYLLSQGLRRVAIILSRKGADPNALKTIAGAMRDEGKLMVPLDDSQVCEMLHMKERGDDPSDFLFGLVDEFLMGLSR